MISDDWSSQDESRSVLTSSDSTCWCPYIMKKSRKILVGTSCLLLYQYTKATSTGTVTKKVEAQAAGPLNHSRWLTLAIRIQQLSTRTPTNTEGQQMLADFIQRVYTPSWFWIKYHRKFTSSPSNLHYQMELVMIHPEEVQNIVKPVVQRNTYFADPALLL